MTKLNMNNDKKWNNFEKKLFYVSFLLVLILFGGALFYHYHEKWTFLDSLYFSAATMTTVGYGDFVPVTDISKIFTIPYMFLGVGIALYGLSIIASRVVEKRQNFMADRVEKLLFRANNKKDQLTTEAKNIRKKVSGLFGYNKDNLVDEGAESFLSLKKK
jgi:voltage-gated potassium channel